MLILTFSCIQQSSTKNMQNDSNNIQGKPINQYLIEEEKNADEKSKNNQDHDDEKTNNIAFSAREKAIKELCILLTEANKKIVSAKGKCIIPFFGMS